MAHSFDRLKELNLSRDEVNRIGEALKKEEFRKLLADYVEEIQDPKNRQLYEDEVCQIEKERGQDVTFLHPSPGYVIKTSVNGSQKGFINICSNSNINKPSSTPTTKEGTRGLQWSLPHSLSPPHEDLDNKGVRCQVFDVLFHPDALHLAYKNAGFRSLLNNTAVEAVESNFNVELDKKNLKFPKLNYKGMKRACIMRTTSKVQPLEKTPEEQEMYNKLFADIDAQRSANSFKSSSPKKTRSRKNSNGDSSSYTTPKYVIKHRSHIDIQEFRESKDAKINAAIPKELIVEVDLPLLKSSSDMNLDVTEKTVQVTSENPAKYKLNLTLPYQVNELNGNAKFDKDMKKLTITLPVKQKLTLQSLKFDDSGVESSVDSDTHSPTSPESDDDYIQEHENVIKPSETLVNTLRTNKSDDFLDASDLYILPEYKCNVFDNTVVFTFNVKNVDEKTVQKRLYSSESFVKLKFTSISPSFYPSCYSFYVKLPSHKFIEDSVTVETWDNDVILQIPLIANETQFCSYYCGLNQDSLSEKFMEKPVIIKSLEKPEPVKESKEPSKQLDNKHDQGTQEALSMSPVVMN
ncbi:hypothetical protein GWI33_012205 [Rhynchophorus ferrugineus]|uniref:Protein kintoun n=1 Tax=Rhynchophorus ferrugineus TaxID=354439 RepID=A0A834I6V7_RHYFE|nr:hypothetical protein GWI33_012205 [Rhynchophorus ferrugineus]